MICKQFSLANITVLLLIILFFGKENAAQINDGESNVYWIKSNQQILTLNGYWKFKYIPSRTLPNKYEKFFLRSFNVSTWDSIPVPGNWEMYGFAKPLYKQPAAGFGLYRTSFTLPKHWKSKNIFIRFEGVLYGYNLWLNGHYVGSWASAFNPCQFNISNYINRDSKNVLAVEVTTRDKGFEFDTNDSWGLSGIFRNVYLFGVPKIHFQDITVKTFLDSLNVGIVGINAKIGLFGKNKSSNLLKLNGGLYDFQGKKINEFSQPFTLNKGENFSVTIKNSIKVVNPLLWNAETPLLYKLKLVIINGRDTLQRDVENVGIRQITIDKGVFKLNGIAIKLKGVNRHEIYPTTGRALTERQQLLDINLMKADNINFVRTSHYPPDENFINLCDEYGIYVMCEVPFGFGDEHLRDTSYQKNLLTRAKATVERDKNHPSIIIWSIGNENPYTPLVENTAKFVKELDPTRPICIPQKEKDFDEEGFDLPKFIDVLSPHYPTPQELEKYAKETERPIIVSEYSHALGLAMEDQGKLWRIMEKYPKLAGGNIWLWADQGILRRTDKKNFPKNGQTDAVWIDSTHYYDSQGNQGSDGIVYSDRTPQVDYWEVRKNYSPIKIKEEKIRVAQGKQNIYFTVKNQYDFIDLLGSYCNWKLYENDSIIQTGAFSPECPAGHSIKIKLKLNIPHNPKKNIYLLNLSFFDKNRHPVYEHSIRLLPEKGKVDLISKLNDEHHLFNLKTQNDSNKVSVFFRGLNFNFKLNKKTGMVGITYTPLNEKYITHGPFARVGRKPTMAERRIKDRYFKDKDYYWYPYLLKGPEILNESVAETNDGELIKVKYKFERADRKSEFIDGTVIYNISKEGWIDVSFNFVPQNATGIFLETGLSFALPRSLTEFRWLGEGPYASYPGKYELNDYGIYHLNCNDIYYEGNRTKVKLAAFTNKHGDGIGVLCDDANISVERTGKGIIFSYNVDISGKGTKVHKSEYLVYAKEVKHIKGKFRIIPLDGKRWPKLFFDIFGNPAQTVKPFHPFLASYDQ